MIVTDPALSSQARIGRHRPRIIVADPEWSSRSGTTRPLKCRPEISQLIVGCLKKTVNQAFNI